VTPELAVSATAAKERVSSFFGCVINPFQLEAGNHFPRTDQKKSQKKDQI
jgi:hypothetical protein